MIGSLSNVINFHKITILQFGSLVILHKFSLFKAFYHKIRTRRNRPSKLLPRHLLGTRCASCSHRLSRSLPQMPRNRDHPVQGQQWCTQRDRSHGHLSRPDYI